MIDVEYKYYKDHLHEFLAEHQGEFVVIKGQEVKGFYRTERQALESMSDHQLGTFLVKKCLPFEQTIADYHSRVVIV